MKALSVLVLLNRFRRLHAGKPVNPQCRGHRQGKLIHGHERDMPNVPIQTLGSDALHHSSWDKPVIVVKTLPG
jgi:hypothetical protein